MKWERSKNSGFTLIELLIVVAIIAILAAIAVPNFLEAQTRAKVSRVKADMRTIAVGLETYTIDWNRTIVGQSEGMGSVPFCWVAGVTNWAELNNTFPSGQFGWRIWNFGRLTTPVAYLTSIPPDPFIDIRGVVNWRPGQGVVPLGPKDKPMFDYQSTSRDGKGTGPGAGYWGMHPVWGGAAMTAHGNGFMWWLESHGPSAAYRNDRWPGGEGGVLFAYAGLEGDLPDSFYDPSNGTVSYGKITRSNKGINDAGASIRFHTNASTKRSVVPSAP